MLHDHFLDPAYFWIMLVSLQDSLLVMLPAILSDPVASLTLGGPLYVGYSLLTMMLCPTRIALPASLT